jgi:hypothetical protein
MVSNPTKASPDFTDIDQGEFDSIIEEMSGNFAHRSLTPASHNSGLLPIGIEVGLIFGSTDTPEINKLDSSSDTGSFPHGGLYGSVGLPFGISLEATTIPDQDLDDINFSYMSGAVKWTFTESLVFLPLDMAFRAHFSSAELDYAQTINTTSVDVSFENDVSGVQLLASASLLGMIEPYVGVGYLKGDGSVNITGSETFLDSSFSSSQSAESDSTSEQILLGAQVNLLLMKLGAEFESSFGTQSVTGKLSFGF